MLTIHFANRFEALEDLLTDTLGAGRGNPLGADEVIVPSAALQRRLALTLARRHGVSAQLRFSYLAQWLWRQAGRVRSAVSGQPAATEPPLQPDSLAWRVWAALGDATWLAGHPRLAAYLADADAVTRHDLAQRMAGLFDQYSTYRPDWLAAWSAHRPALPPGTSAPDEAWQAALWRRLAAELAPAPDIERLINPLGPALPAGAALPPDTGLPAVAHVFCLPTIAPVHLALLQQLGRWIDLHVYALNPCREYWFELVEPRRLARLAARGRAGHHEVGHRLLAAWGRQAQAQLAALVDTCGDAALDDEHYAPHPGRTRLAALHNSLLDLQDLAPRSVPLQADDRSIELHVCHSLTRELEVLQDMLLSLFAQPGAPAPGEVLVAVPDLEAAAPLIDSVFGTAPRERALPYTVTGQAVSRVNAPARALLAALALAGSRGAVSEVFGLLQQPVVARRFGLDDEGLARVHRWLQDSGVHWALDARHRAALGLPDGARHSLADGLDRLYLGYALPDTVAQPLGAWLPAGAAEGTAALTLGALWRFADLLARLRERLARPLLPAAASALLLGLADELLAPDDRDLDDLAELRAAIGTLAGRWQQAGLAQPLPADVLRQALAEVLDDPARGGVPTGRITFTSLSPLRGLPYRVVCLLGLNDGEFPSAQRPAEFDLMAAAPRAGDRQRRIDERNLFLDLVLAARDRLHLSHTGRSVRDNAPLPPSVLVAELLETLLPALDTEPAQALDRLVLHHPLQAFDPSLFDAATDPRLRSHQADYAQALAAAQRARAARPAGAGDAAGDLPDLAAARVVTAVQAGVPGDGAADPPAPEGTDSDEASGDAADEQDDDRAADPALPFFARPLPPLPAQSRRVTLAGLQRFFRHPCRQLLQQRLGLSLPRPDEALDDDEPFLPDHRARQALAQRLLPVLAAAPGPAAVDDAVLRVLAEASTGLPGGLPGRQLVDAELPLLRRHAQALAEATATPPLPPHRADFAFDIDGSAWTLEVALADLRPDGALLHRYSDARAGDYLEAWLQHLALCACAPAGVAGTTTWLGRDGPFRLQACDDPLPLLQGLLAQHAQGLQAPLYLFPRSAWAWLKPDGSLAQARQAWQASARQPFAEQADAANRLALRGLPDPLGDGLPDFERTARTVFTPLLACLDDPRHPQAGVHAGAPA